MKSLWLAMTALLSTPLVAAPPTAPPVPSGWQFGAGVGLIVNPTSLGARDYRLLPVPNLEARYQDWFSFNPVDGPTLRTKTEVAGRSVSLSTGIGIDFANRDPDETPRLRGLSSISQAPAFRLRAETRFDRLDTSVMVLQRLGNSSGLIVQGDLGSGYPASDALFLKAGLTSRWMNGAYADRFFTVSPDAAVASGLSAYQAEAGWLDAGLYGQAVYRLNPRWTLFSRAQLTQFQGDARNSPILETRQQLTWISFLNYRF